MDRRTTLSLAAASAIMAGTASGCGEPVAVLGDNPGVIRVVAGIPEEFGNVTDSLALRSHLNQPSGVVVAEDGVVYVADRRNRRVVAITSSGRFRIVLDHLRCVGECLVQPLHLALDGADGLYVSDRLGQRIWRIDLVTGAAAVFLGTGEAGESADGSPVSPGTEITGPRGISVGPAGDLYFAESQLNRIRVARADGTLGTVAGTGERGFTGDGGLAPEAKLDFPTDIAVSGQTMYVMDAGNNRIRAVDLPGGNIRTIAGSGVRGFGGDGGSALDALFDVPESIAVSPEGTTLYIADSRNHRVRALQIESGIISTLVGSGDTRFGGDLIDAGAASLELPFGVATSDFGLLFVGDTGHEIVWRMPVSF
ncbi:MAG: hypothetical protein ABFS14_01130 [Gemmatimonadota bacterium]